MRFTVLILVLSICGMARVNKGVGAGAPPDVDLYIVDHSAVEPALLYRATMEATDLLAAAGVRVEWRSKPSRKPGCRPSITITIEGNAPDSVRSGVSGLTHLENGNITVFYDRVRDVVSLWPSLASAFLAQVFAHEIGHSLQRLKRHAESGTMKAHWTVNDYRAMQNRVLNFSEEDAALIRAGVMRTCPALY